MRTLWQLCLFVSFFFFFLWSRFAFRSGRETTLSKWNDKRTRQTRSQTLSAGNERSIIFEGRKVFCPPLLLASSIPTVEKSSAFLLRVLSSRFLSVILAEWWLFETYGRICPQKSRSSGFSFPACRSCAVLSFSFFFCVFAFICLLSLFS